ncbi:MAG: hypothetical protein EAZ57_01290 [Cytophagales bacterium]|nr:MAG: hypothetical protein EAZ67_01985 [Cytophagales bacterium]TAF62084.1 MAG: hypothetical protein EAZ57_01290 [Cytophagales bacterium]
MKKSITFIAALCLWAWVGSLHAQVETPISRITATVSNSEPEEAVEQDSVVEISTKRNASVKNSGGRTGRKGKSKKAPNQMIEEKAISQRKSSESAKED